jgi:hypothetical protein
VTITDQKLTVPLNLDEVTAAFTPRKDSSPEPCALDVVREFVSRFVYASDAELDIITAWIAHTYVFEAYYATPRLSIMSPVFEAGKTTVLNMITALAKNAILTVNASGPSLFAIIGQEHPTLCFDEADNMWGENGEKARYRDQLAILNSGYTQDGFVLRSQNGTAKKYPVFVVAAFAGKGKLPDAMMTRSIPIRMMPLPSNVEVEDYEPDLFKGEAARVAETLQNWLAERGPELDLQPIMPEGLKSRKRQIWKVMVAIGDLAGNVWSAKIRRSAREIALGITRTAHVSPAEELIQLVTSITQVDTFLPTGELINLLKLQRDHDNRLSWAVWLDNPIIATRQIANVLRPYGIESQQKWLSGENRRGYHAGDFHLWAQTKKTQTIVAQPEKEEVEAE